MIPISEYPTANLLFTIWLYGASVCITVFVVIVAWRTAADIKGASDDLMPAVLFGLIWPLVLVGLTCCALWGALVGAFKVLQKVKT